MSGASPPHPPDISRARLIAGGFGKTSRRGIGGERGALGRTVRPVSSASPRMSAERRADVDSVPLEPDRARRLRWEALRFAILAFLVYLANGRVLTHGDSLATRYLPFAMWKDGSLRLDSVADVATRILPDQWGPDPHWIAKGPDGHLYSRYPVTQPVILTPFYAPAAVYLAWRGWDPERIERLGVLHEKI